MQKGSITAPYERLPRPDKQLYVRNVKMAVRAVVP